MLACKYCDKEASGGIQLSDGGVLHGSCYNSIQNKEKVFERKISSQEVRLRKYKKELQRRDGLLFKISSIFAKPKINISDIWREIKGVKGNIAQLSSNMSLFKAEVSLIYDFFLTYPPDWSGRRNKVTERDGDNCCKCTSRSRLHLHHIKPLSRGGSNKISNLKLLCEECHSKAHGGRDFSGVFTSSETAFSKSVSSIRFAIGTDRCIEFGYKKPTDNDHKQRTVKPTELVSVAHHRDHGATLCVRGHCELRKAERVFALKRMRNLKVI